jgi:indolepyruvate ferredoxin oxidoreductase beta subunit
MDELKKLKNTILVDVDSIAREAGNPRGANIALLGACSHLLGMESQQFEEGIRRIFSDKGEEVVEANLKAFKAGQDASL